MSMPTRRQLIVELLETGTWGFDELRADLGQGAKLPVRVLESDLAHVEKSVRAGGRRIEVEPPECLECGFVFRGGGGGRGFHPPSRCPRCRSERVSQPRLTIR